MTHSLLKKLGINLGLLSTVFQFFLGKCQGKKVLKFDKKLRERSNISEKGKKETTESSSCDLVGPGGECMAFWGSLLLPPPNFLFPVNPRLFFTNHLPANQLFLLYVSFRGGILGAHHHHHHSCRWGGIFFVVEKNDTYLNRFSRPHRQGGNKGTHPGVVGLHAGIPCLAAEVFLIF